jgi:hypothetical protein
MHNGIGMLHLGLEIEDFRKMALLESDKTFSAHADVRLKFQQPSGSGPLQLTASPFSYHGAGSLQVQATYTDGGPVERNGRTGYQHSVVLQFTYSSNTSRTQSSTQQYGAEVSISPPSIPGAGLKMSAGSSSALSTTVTDSSVSWVREIQFTSWDVPAGQEKPFRGSNPW